MATATQIIFAQRPAGAISPETFTVKHVPIPSAASLPDGSVLVEALYLSVDPVMRVWLSGVYYMPLAPGDLMAGNALVRVVASRSDKAAVGDYALAWTGWVSHAVVPGDSLEKIDLPEGCQLSDFQSFLGVTGLTGYFGMTRQGKPKKGDTVVVSAAAGATGNVAAQVAKILGARVVGIAGGPEKCRWLTEELGLDVAVDYKADDFEEKFADAVKGGIDVYFDNVGGKTLQMAIDKLNTGARIAICGDISNYNTVTSDDSKFYANDNQNGITNIFSLALRSATMQGVNIFENMPDAPAARVELARWAREGKLKRSETVVKGPLERAPELLMDLFVGKNTGKLMLEVERA